MTKAESQNRKRIRTAFEQGYMPTVKATTPAIKITKTTSPKSPPTEGRQHAGRVWNKERPHQRPKSTLANEPKVPDQRYPTKTKMAPGVPTDPNVKRGYFPPGAKPTKTLGEDAYT